MELGLISGFALGSLFNLTSNGTLAKHRTMRKLFSFDYATITITGPDDSPLQSWDEYDPSIITEASYKSQILPYGRSLWVTKYLKGSDNFYLGPIFIVGTYIIKVCMFD